MGACCLSLHAGAPGLVRLCEHPFQPGSNPLPQTPTTWISLFCPGWRGVRGACALLCSPPDAALGVKLCTSCQHPGMERGFTGSQPSPCAGGRGGLQRFPPWEQLVPIPSLTYSAAMLHLTSEGH